MLAWEGGKVHQGYGVKVLKRPVWGGGGVGGGGGGDSCIPFQWKSTGG